MAAFREWLFRRSLLEERITEALWIVARYGRIRVSDLRERMIDRGHVMPVTSWHRVTITMEKRKMVDVDKQWESFAPGAKCEARYYTLAKPSPQPTE